MMMTPNSGQKVKCIFQNGGVIEGIVEAWNSVDAILITKDQKTVLIHNPNRDLLMTIIFPNQEIQKPSLEKLSHKIKEVEQEISLRSRSLADLHALKVAAEKEELAKKMKSHHIDPDRANTNHLLGPSDFIFRRKK